MSYSYYVPWKSENTENENYRNGDEPNDNYGPRYTQLITTLAHSIKDLYPGWRMRIYHNVSDSQEQLLLKVGELKTE